MASLQAWLASQASAAIWAMVAASLLPMLFSYVAKLMGGFRLKDNAHPRTFLANVDGVAARADAAQQNSFETLPVFLAAVITAMLFFVPQGVINSLAWMYVVLRVAYGVAYMVNWATLRSVLWVLALACPLLLFYLSIRLMG